MFTKEHFHLPAVSFTSFEMEKKRRSKGKGRNGKINASSEGNPTQPPNTEKKGREKHRFRRYQSNVLPESSASTTSTEPRNLRKMSVSLPLDRKDSTASKRSARTKKIRYVEHIPLTTCLARYGSGDPSLIRGKIRVIAGGQLAFVACDRGSIHIDVVIDGEMNRNRAMDGDLVYVEVLPPAAIPGAITSEGFNRQDSKTTDDSVGDVSEHLLGTRLMNPEINSDFSNVEETLDDSRIDYESTVDDLDETSAVGEPLEEEFSTWQEDPIQMRLWNPTVSIRKSDKTPLPKLLAEGGQRRGQVIHVVPTRLGISRQASELNPADECHLQDSARRTIVGVLKKLPSDSNPPRYLLVPNNRSLPCFMTPFHTHADCNLNNQSLPTQLYRAEYVYGSWMSGDKWPPCVNIKIMGQSLNVEDETEALLVEYGVNHGEFSPKVLKSVEDVVRSGRHRIERPQSPLGVHEDLGWSPTEDMYVGRRDYREERIFTIDPTTAKDLDDAVHIKQLPGGRVEIGVHIADVSYFVSPGTAVDDEAAKRATTVYLVDRTITMLPRPLCEIACSLNENVERLAFSCVWIMNADGTLGNQDAQRGDKDNFVWYGRTVIRSCARLDYATAQNIIDGKVAYGEAVDDVDEKFWPKSRQPTGGHTIDEVAADVRLMHKVAMARRKLRFAHGAVALHGAKLTFQLEEDGQTPSLCEPYPIRDSNRLIEEYMLLANYLVAQKLITSAGGLALLRHHPPPLSNGMQNVIAIAKESVGFVLDGSSSQALQESLSTLGRECTDQLAMQCVTELLMTPMRPAEYIAAGEFDEIQWRHFALNIPYYTHFTSPIRRYADILVHRLLQATLDEEDGVNRLSLTQSQLQSQCEHCNDLRMAAKKAQERSDRIFLSLFLREHPARCLLAVILSIGEKTFTVFVPSLALTTKVFLDDHVDAFDFVTTTQENRRSISMRPKGENQTSFDLHIFMKLAVSCHMKPKPPLDVQVMVIGPWSDFSNESSDEFRGTLMNIY